MGSPAYFKRKSLLSVSVEFYRDKSLFLGILKRIRRMGFSNSCGIPGFDDFNGRYYQSKSR
uniref:Uncharacterized protein n=1 Tax=Leptospira santarosai serovar Arenal str. MAVJ 401 TaxID=1049976 RepID=M6JX61_9LEPT|nr:hypothetical protein LEP1GSC063_2015 [Leptospira santarosai serovar Arenal str. MAVJ 401]